MANLSSGMVGETVVVVVNDHTPLAAEWDAHLALLKQQLDKAGKEPTKLVVFSGGGTPDSPMRLKFRDLARGRLIQAAVVSDSAVVRAIISVFSLFVDGMRPFAAKEWRGALEYAGISLANLPDYLGTLRQLNAEVGGSKAMIDLLREAS